MSAASLPAGVTPTIIFPLGSVFSHTVYCPVGTWLRRTLYAASAPSVTANAVLRLKTIAAVSSSATATAEFTFDTESYSVTRA